MECYRALCKTLPQTLRTLTAAATHDIGTRPRDALQLTIY